MRETTVEDLQGKLDKLITWTPEFERGYDWSKFCADNAVPPVLCHGTRADAAEKIREYGFIPKCDQSPVMVLHAQLRDIIFDFANNYSYPLVESQGDYISAAIMFNENQTFAEASRKFYVDSERTYFTLYPGTAWCYTQIGGENLNNFIPFAMTVLSNLRTNLYQGQKISAKDEATLKAFESELKEADKKRTSSPPAIVLVQTQMDKFKQDYGASNFFLHEETFSQIKYEIKNRPVAKLFPAAEEGMLLCAEQRYLTKDLRFQFFPGDDEVYTTQPIPPEDVVGILIAED